MTSKNVKFVWMDVHQKAFEDIKKIICREVMLTFPDFSKPFHIYTDASDIHLGAVITQDNKPSAFYSRKLNSAQKRYTTGEQELLAIVETVREFRNILLGYKIIVHTDHKKITYAKSTSDRVMLWRLLIEEFGPEFKYIQGKHNLIADALSCLEMEDSSGEPILDKPTHQCMAAIISRTKIINDKLSPSDGFEMAESFGIKTKEKTKDEDYKFPMQFPYIAEMQNKDKSLKKELMKSDNKYELTKIERTLVLTIEGNIFIPTVIQQKVIAWYHKYLCHPGATRTEATIRGTMT
jgi:hypothetical protein